ncbi:type II toxin-antitoxin system Phd/YefM family antitoxin [Lautropia mirabilis]
MRTITASKARQGFAELLESVDQGPVIIERQRRGVAVVMSVAEYWRLRQLDSATQAWASAQPEAQGTSPAGRQKEEGAEAGYRVAEKAAAGMPAQREGKRRQMGTLKGQLTIPEDFDRWLEDEIQALFAGQESSEAELLRSSGKAK